MTTGWCSMCKVGGKLVDHLLVGAEHSEQSFGVLEGQVR